MNETLALGTLLAASIILGYVKYRTIDKDGEKWPPSRKFIELWNCFVNFLVPAIVIFYLAVVRWPYLYSGQSLTLADFALITLLILGMFGHLSTMSFNITKGVEAILNRIMNK